MARRWRSRDRAASGGALTIIRRAEQEDLWPAAEVYLRSRQAAVPAIPPLVHDDQDVRDWFAEAVFPRQELWIAEDTSGAVVGLMVLDGDFVEQLYVDPARVGCGIGSELLAVARSLQLGGLQLWTFQSNDGARRFYERHSFMAVEWTDGTGNEEQAPDVRYVWRPK